MPLSWNEVKGRASKFSKEWATAKKEASDKQTFWNEFFDVFGMSRKRVATFEEGVKKYEGEHGSIDLFYPGKLIVEHKSEGKDLDDAYQQAIEYAAGLPEKVAPTHIVVSDFARFRVYNLEATQEERMYEFRLEELSKYVKLFGFLLGYQTVKVRAEDPVNQKAVKAIAKLHDSLGESGYSGHQLGVLLVRLVYCFFADDTGLFDELDSLEEYLKNRTNVDGSDTGLVLSQIFQVLNQPKEQRQKNLDEELARLPYIDGPLFEEKLDFPTFDSAMRNTLLECSTFDWGKVSPVIFGSMFQSVMDKKARHDVGAHYTSETNIFKVIDPLFLDELKEELELAGKSKNKLHAFLSKIRSLRFLDPACGCGNFLVVTYRELRRLELEALKRLNISVDTGARQTSLLQFGKLSQINVDQMYGIEIDEFSARIAELALWLTDHQMNMELSAEFGENFVRLPLKTHPNIHIANALRLDWSEVIEKEQLSYILGNPPFLGHHLQTPHQKQELRNALHDISAAGVMDYVSGWYSKATDFIQGTKIEVSFVSTNSITQGEQVGILWGDLLLPAGIKINFAHRTFKWSNEAQGRAAVFCVILGFSCVDRSKKVIYSYYDVRREAHTSMVSRINPYLIEADDVIVRNRTKPLCEVPAMSYGNKATDGGNFILSDSEKNVLLTKYPAAAKYIKRYIGAEDFLHNETRWCIWLPGFNPAEVKAIPPIMERIEKVKQFRSESKALITRNYQYHSLFRQITQPESDYVLVPRVSSENRIYIPLAFFSKDNIVSDSCQAVGGANLYHFGILSSELHMVWVRQVCGRLEGRYRYSKDIVYNNFPWPQSPTVLRIKAVEDAAQGVLDARSNHPGSSLAVLYDQNAMPPDLVKAHHTLDKAVDLCYGKKKFNSEIERLEFLFGMYKELIVKESAKETKVLKKKVLAV